MLRSQIAKNAWPRHAPHHFVRAATVSLPEGKGRQRSEPAKDKAGPRGLAPWVGRMFTCQPRWQSNSANTDSDARSGRRWKTNPATNWIGPTEPADDN